MSFKTVSLPYREARQAELCMVGVGVDGFVFVQNESAALVRQINKVGCRL